MENETQIQPDNALAVIGVGAIGFTRNPFEDTALVIPAEMDLTEAQMLELGERIARVGRGDKFWIGDYLNQMKARYPDAYKRAEALFYDDKDVSMLQQLKNMSYVCNAVAPERRRLTFTHCKVVAPLAEDLQVEMLEKAASYVDPTTNLPRVMTVAELDAEVKAVVTAAKAAANLAAGVEPPLPAVAPYIDLVVKVPKMAGDEKPADFKSRATNLFNEALKRHMNPDYAVKATEKERRDAFKVLVASVPKEDQVQFNQMLTDGADLKFVEKQISNYFVAVEDAKKLEDACALLPESERAPFVEMRKGGKSIKEIAAAVKIAAKKREDKAALTDALKPVAEADRVQFYAQLDAGAKLKEISKAIKTHLDGVERQNEITKLLEPVAEEDRAPFLDMAKAGDKMGAIRGAVREYRIKKRDEGRVTAQKQNQQIKTLKTLKTRRDNLAKSVALLKANEGDADSQAQAAVLEQQVAKLTTEIEAAEIAVAKATNQPAVATELPFSKAKQVAASKGKGKKKASK